MSQALGRQESLQLVTLVLVKGPDPVGFPSSRKGDSACPAVPILTRHLGPTALWPTNAALALPQPLGTEHKGLN